ncbi:hypothetical protein GCK72_018530 [Caenorhabditis remanei]|uniref:Uncharacterized protein n=1 Tax=Caenorhabditis remanei TaxID=31234 RepID=A0A6A5GAY3_CAERE|nr:hypothetical protein GCK72_018530 [Caenorhabditis remanei]KAF1751976.1 hypothetical protein GCK72_018530 [Caenorhabditis remanei]
MRIIETDEQAATEDEVLSLVLDGTFQPSLLKAYIEHISDENSLKWNFQIAEAIMENKPLQVLKLAGSHQFNGQDQKEIALILVGCACEMINIETSEVSKTEVQNNGPQEIDRSQIKVSGKNSKTSGDNKDPKSLKTGYDGHISEGCVQMYSEKYEEDPANIHLYFQNLANSTPTRIRARNATSLNRKKRES